MLYIRNYYSKLPNKIIIFRFKIFGQKKGKNLQRRLSFLRKSKICCYLLVVKSTDKVKLISPPSTIHNQTFIFDGAFGIKIQLEKRETKTTPTSRQSNRVLSRWKKRKKLKKETQRDSDISEEGKKARGGRAAARFRRCARNQSAGSEIN